MCSVSLITGTLVASKINCYQMASVDFYFFADSDSFDSYAAAVFYTFDWYWSFSSDTWVFLKMMQMAVCRFLNWMVMVSLNPAAFYSDLF